MRELGAGADVEVVDAVVLEPAADAQRLLDRVPLREPGEDLVQVLAQADLEAEAEVVTDLALHRANDLEREARAVLERRLPTRPCGR